MEPKRLGEKAWLIGDCEREAYLVACEQAAATVNLGSFKRMPAYRPILEHVSQDAGRKYLKIILTNNPQLQDHFDRFAENDRFGDPRVFSYDSWRFSPTTLRYIKVVSDLIDLFGGLAGMRIIEIGGGYGGQCKIIADVFEFQSYTIVDLPPVADLQRKYLSLLNVAGCRCITPDQLTDGKYDLVISNYALSELDRSAQDAYTDAVLRHSQRGYLTWNSKQMPHVHRLPAPVTWLEERPRTGPDNKIFVWGALFLSHKGLKKIAVDNLLPLEGSS